MIGRILLTIYSVVGMLSIFLFFRKRRNRCWAWLFFLTAIVTHTLDSYIVARKYIEYPIRILPSLTKTCILFDFIYFPMFVTLFCKKTKNDKTISVIKKAFLFTTPIAINEHVIKKRSNLIVYNNWSIFHSYSGLVVLMLAIRFTQNSFLRLKQSKNFS